MYIKTKIGKRIKQLRESAEMSQKDLAYTADLDRSYITSVENGQRNIRDYEQKFCTFLINQ